VAGRALHLFAEFSQQNAVWAGSPWAKVKIKVMLKQQFDKPEFWFNPSQIWRRVTFALSGNSSDMTVTLPWGANLKVNSAESIGRSCCTQGIYDLPVTESLFRLISPGDLCVDVGANIGHMTMAMSYCAGSAGAVIAFEPYEPIHARLVENVRTLQNVGDAPTGGILDPGYGAVKDPLGFWIE
jgi:hypothetical protein